MKTKIKLIFLGNPPHSINKNLIENWHSDLFEVIKPIDTFRITENADLNDWAFSDTIIAGMLPETYEGDILIAITSVPLQGNYYTRRFSNNRICSTFFEIGDFLKYENIPLENFVLRILYSASVVYKRFNGVVPSTVDYRNLTHDETKGCIFDMNGIKNEIIYSTNKPIICNDCVNSITNDRVGTNVIESAQKELKRIRKSLYYRIADLIKKHPVWALVLSSILAIVLGIIGSLIASYLWEFSTKK